VALKSRLDCCIAGNLRAGVPEGQLPRPAISCAPGVAYTLLHMDSACAWEFRLRVLDPSGSLPATVDLQRRAFPLEATQN
jgi:hypothetical protein